MLRRWIDSSAKPEIFARGSSVLAGNTYVSKGLRQNPSYLFQIAASDANYLIFRTSLSAPVANAIEEVNNLDAYSLNNSLFESIAAILHYESAKFRSSYDEIATHYLLGDMLTCLFAPSFPGNEIIELDFPVKHMNFGRNTRCGKSKLVLRCLPS